MFSVKSIFKTLIGTVLLIVFSSFIIEMFNIMTTGLQINQLTRLACKQSCTLFSQETYKQRTDNQTGNSGGTVATSPIQMRLDDGSLTTVHSGNFYGNGSARDIYNKLYGTGSDFISWCNSSAATKGNWKNLNLIKRGLTEETSLRNIRYNINDPVNDAYTQAQLALLYKDTMMTPLNIGIPYLDKDTVENIFQWNLLQILSNCNPDLIKNDNGRPYVNFKGFAIYPLEAKITSIDYKVYDLTKASDRAEFNRETNINPDKLSFGDTVNMDAIGSGSAVDERQRVCIAGIQYDIPVAYKGITPIARVFEDAWNHEVEGLEGSTPGHVAETFSTPESTLSLGGFTDDVGNVNSGAGELPVPGDLTFYLVR